MNGLKIKIPDYKSKVSPDGQEEISNQYPLLKSALGKTPPHSGLVEIKIGSLAPGKKIDAITVPHGYDYRPQFFAVWQFDEGFYLSNKQQTFGTWWLQAETTFGSGETFDSLAMVDDRNFYISVYNSGVNITNVASQTIKWRYYIFSNPL